MTLRLLAFAYAVIAIALIATRPAATPGPPARDFEAYWSAGSTANAGADPYSPRIWDAERTVPGVDSRRDEILPFIDPPSTLLGWRALAAMPYATATALWLTLLALALIVLIVATLYGSRERITALSFFAAVALAIAFGPITSDLALGQLAMLAFAAATLFVIVVDRSIPAAVVAAAVAFAQPNVAIGLASQLGRIRAVVALVLGAFVAYGLGALAAGRSWPLSFARAALAHGTAERFVAIQITPGAIAYGFGLSAAAAEVLALVVAALAIAAGVAIAVAVRDSFARFAGCSALVPFVAAFAHEHDLVVAYPAALWCALRTRGSTRIVALAGTLLVCVDWLGLAQRPTGVAQSALLAAAAAAVFVSLGPDREARAAWLLLPATALFTGSVLLAVHHSAPVWPDALGAFHAQQSTSVAAIWLAEQRANGLLAVAPAWAFLRTLPLLGCALLAHAIYRRP